MKKRNFWAKCIAFLLVVVMVLSEQNITTLGETIGSYAQERMAGSSEQETERAIIKEDSSQESSSAAGSSASSSETSTTQESAKETTTQAVTVETTEETDTSQQINSSVQSSQTENEKITKGAEENSQQDQNKKKRAAEAQGEEEKSDAQKAKKAEKKIAKQVEKTKGMTYLEAAEQYYGDPETGDGGTMETASVTIRQRGSDTKVKAGGTVSFVVDYKLTAAAYFNYGDLGEPLFDTYDDTKIILHLPEGLRIDEKAEGTLQNVTKIIPPAEDSKTNDWVLELNNSIRASSDTTGSFLMTLQIENNGAVEAGHIFDFGEGSKLAEICTNFTIMDRTGITDVASDIIYNNQIGTDSKLNDLQAVTDDIWKIDKTAVSAVANADKTKVTVTFNLAVGLDSGNGTIISNPESYGREGRVPFAGGNTITLKETPSVKDREGNPIQAESITVTPNFGGQQTVSVSGAGASVSIPVDTCGNHNLGQAVAESTPYYSTYKVEIVYPYDSFIAQYYDEKQGLLKVENEAEITYQLAGETQSRTSKDSAVQEAGEVTRPAALKLEKYIFRYDDEQNASAVAYTSTNYASTDVVKGTVTYKITGTNGQAATLYSYDAEAKTYTELTDANGVVTYNPQTDTSGNVIVYLDPGTYTVSEVAGPENTEKVTTGTTNNANDKKVTIAAGATETAAFYNKETLGEITIQKKGQNGGTTGVLAGAVFGLYSDKACEKEIVRVTTGSDGNGKFTRLAYDDYYVKEISAPEGYIKDESVYSITLPDAQNKISVTQESINKYNLAPVKMQKQIYDVNKNDYVNVNNTNSARFNGCFAIEKKTGDNQWETLSGYSSMSLGSATGAIETSLPVFEDDGQTLITYRFKETLPTGYHAADANNEFEENGTRVTYSEEFNLENYLGNASTSPYTVTMKNTQNGSINLTKDFYTATINGVKKSTDQTLTADFVLYYKDGEDGGLTRYGTDTYTVKAGQNITIADLPRTGANGTDRYYYLVETKLPEGYASSDQPLAGNNDAEKAQMTVDGQSMEVYGPFNFTKGFSTDTESETGEIVLEQSVTINNVEQKVPIVVKKANSYTDAFVSGAEYTIYEYAENQEDHRGDVVSSEKDRSITSATGTLSRLEPGKKYVIVETKAPTGYKDVTDGNTLIVDLIKETKVDTTTQLRTFTIENQPDPTFNLTKQRDNAEGNNTTLSGVQFEVYQKNDAEKFVRVNGYDGKPLIFTAGNALQVPAGEYYLKEVKGTAEGVLDPSTYPDLYTGEGEKTNEGFFFGPYPVKQQQNQNSFDPIVNYSDKGAVTVKKYRKTIEGKEEALNGAVIGIYTEGEGGTLVEKARATSTNGQVTFNNLPIYDEAGKKITYIIKEISAPQGYTLSEESLRVALEPGETVNKDSSGQELKIVNQPVTSLTVEKNYHNMWDYAFTGKDYLLPGTVIALYKKNTEGNYDFVETQVTNGTGLAVFENLTQKDEYVAIEVRVPEGEAYQYLEPSGHKQYLDPDYTEDKDLPKTISAEDLGNYSYVTKVSNNGNPVGAQTGYLLNVENWAQLQIKKYVIEEAGHENVTPGDKRNINNAQFNLYMEVLDVNTSTGQALSFEQDKVDSKYTLIGSYSSGTLYDENGVRKDGWFGTDILKSANNVVYWLVETNAGIGASIRGENVVTLIKREGTEYTNNTTYTLDGETYNPKEVMDYKDNQVTKEEFQNNPEYGGGGEMFSTVRIAKWAGERTKEGDKIYDKYTPLGNATFDLYLADSDGNTYAKLDTLTTGLDNNITGDSASQQLSAWASSKAFSWTDMKKLKEGYLEELANNIFIEDSNGNYYVRVAIRESEAPSGYEMDKYTYYMYMFFQNNSGETTEIFNDAYYVKGNGDTADKNVPLAETQDGIKWALYPTKETSSGGYEKNNAAKSPANDSVDSMYRLVNWPTDTQAVTVQMYGYEVQTDNLTMNSEQLDDYYASGSHADRTSLTVTMRLERYDEEKQTWEAYGYDAEHADGIFTTIGGYFAFPNGLQMGNYRIVETTAAQGYENIYHGKTVAGSNGSQNAAAYYFQVVSDNVHISMYNPKQQSFTVKKTDMSETASPLSGVTFTLTRQEDNTVKITGTTGEDGTAVLANIGTGTYKLSENTINGYTNSYFAKYFAMQYGETQSTDGKLKLNNLVNGDGIFLGYTTSLNAGENGTSVSVMTETDIYDYGLAASSGIALDIKNPATISFNIRKQDANTEEPVNGAVFKVEYLPFAAISGNINVSSNDTLWTTVSTTAETAGTDTEGKAQGIAAITGQPGVYRITETGAPSGYDRTDTAPKYIAMTGGLNIGDVTVDGNTEPIAKDTDITMVFRDDKQVKLAVTKVINKGSMSVSGNHAFTFTLYDSTKKPIKTLTITTENGNSKSGEFTGLSQEQTYYLKETGVKEGFAFTALKDGSGKVMTADKDGYYRIDVGDSTEDISVTAENTYLYGKISIRKADGENGIPLSGAQFRIERVAEDGKTESVNVTFAEEQGNTGVYTATVPLEGTVAETFRIYETKAPDNYLLDTEHYITVTLNPGEVIGAPDLPSNWNDSKYAESTDRETNNTVMLGDRIFPDYRGAYVDLTKYDNVYAAKSTAEAQQGAGFTLYQYDEESETWVSAGSATTDEEGKLRFVVNGGLKYALEETTVPSGYQGLEGIYQGDTKAEPVLVQVGDETKTLYQINGGNPVVAGTVYGYEAYDIPYLSLQIRKFNALDPESRLTATAAVYEVPEDVKLDSDKAVTEFLNGTEDGDSPTPLIDDINVTRSGGTGTEQYNYADMSTDSRLGGAIIAGKTYLVVEKTANTSQIRDNAKVEWYDVITVPAGTEKDQVQTAILRNIIGTAPLSLKKATEKTSYTSLFTEAAEVKYTITPTVNSNTYPLADFTVTDTGLTAYSNGVALPDSEIYLKGNYSLQQVTIGQSSHETDAFVGNGTADDIYATVIFYDSDGNEIYRSTPLNVSRGAQTAALPLDKGKAAKVSVSYESADFKVKTESTLGTAYALGANFKPGAITITAEIDQQKGGTDKKAIDQVRNTAESMLHYYPWDVSGVIATEPSEMKDTALADITFEEQKGAKISVTKAIEGNEDGSQIRTVNLLDVITYNITISNDGTSEAVMQEPFIVDYLPQGTSWVNYDADNEVNLLAGDTGITYNHARIQTSDGENAIFIFLNGNLDPGESIIVQLKARVENTVTSYGTTMSNYALVGSNVRGVASEDNPQAASFKNRNDEWAENVDTVLAGMSEERLNTLKGLLGTQADYGYVSASASVDWASSSDTVLVKSAYGDRNEDDGYSTDILSTVNNGGTMHYRLSVSNTSGFNGATEFSVIDILPNIGDITSGNAGRESAWGLTFGDISGVYVNGKPTKQYKVYYYTGTLNGTEAYRTLYNQILDIGYDTTGTELSEKGWTKEKPDNVADIKAFIVATDNSVRLGENDTFVIEYTATVNNGEEWDAATLNNNSWKNAVNSFSCTYSKYDLQTESVAEPINTVIGSNQVSNTIMPEQVSVGGHIWIDKDADGVWDSDESINNFGNNQLIQEMLENVEIRLYSYSGTETTGSIKSEYDTAADTQWKTNANYVFGSLDPAMVKENTSEDSVYTAGGVFPGGTLNPAMLKGTAPATYTINISFPQEITGKYGVTSIGTTSGRSQDPTAIPEAETKDNNFVTGNSGAESERFYLWATDPKIFDNTKDIGLVPYRELTITKTAEDDPTEKISGVSFTIYGPFDTDTISSADLTEEKKIETLTTDANGQVTFGRQESAEKKLLWYKNYVVVEDSTQAGYSLNNASATAGEGTNFSQINGGINGKPAWILKTPSDSKTTAVDQVTITNEKTPTTVSLTAVKSFMKSGQKQNLVANDFMFELWDKEPGTAVEGTAATPIQTKGNAADGSVTFDELSFTSEGTYYYYITEQLETDEDGQEQNPYNGINYDTSVYRATVEVTWNDGNNSDQGETQTAVGLTNTVTYAKQNADGQWVDLESSGDVKFTNTYNATGSWTPEGTKTLTGRDLKEGETYTFSVREVTTGDGQNTGDDTAAGETTVPADSTGSVTGGRDGQPSNITFTPINYTLDDVGTHTYIITEDVTDEIKEEGYKSNGVVYDDTQYTVTVEVTDNGDGTLNVVPQYPSGGVQFTNKYEPTSIPYAPSVTKNLTGHWLPNATGTKNFVFTLQAVQNPDNGAVLPEDTELTVTINGKTNEATATNSGTFDEITFTKAGTYTFTIAEKAVAGDTGYTYDEAQWTLTVTVTDDGNGNLSFNGTPVYASNQDGVDENATGAVFTNNYQPVSTTANLKVSKAVEGSPMPQAETFTFVQSLESGNASGVQMPANNQAQITVSQTGENGRQTAEFNAITFTKAGTYTFLITENVDNLPDGYEQNIESIRRAQVTVVDNNGQLEVSDDNIIYYLTDVNAPDEGNEASLFTNRYDTVDTVFAPMVTKALTGDIPAGTKTFTFSIAQTGGDEASVTMPQSLTTTVSYTNETGERTASFGEITFTEAGTYTFAITEEAGTGNDGYIYDDSQWNLTVTVVDDNSRLRVDSYSYVKVEDNSASDSVGENESADQNVAQGEAAEAASFTNVYDTEPVTYAPQVQKTVNGEIPEGRDADFNFTLTYVSAQSAYTGVDASDGIENLTLGDTKNLTITGNGTGTFEQLTFTKAGTYTFQIAETAGNQNGYTYDGSIWNLTVTVEDKGGYLKVTDKTYVKANVAAGQDNGENEDHATFTNTYSVTPDAFTPQVEKQFSDDSVARPNAKDFTFTLTADEKNPTGGAFTGYDETTGSGTALEGAYTIETKVNGSGTGTFDTITFTKAGTYKFRIQEEAGSDLGYTYDDAVWTLTVQVDDIGGALQVTNNDVTYQSNDTTVEPNNEKAVFVNEYHYISSIIINKEVLRGNAEYETNDMFYAGIFRKVDNTGDGTGSETGNISYEIVKNVVVDNKTVESGVVQLANNDSVEVYVPLGGEDQTKAITYYVFETDAEGHPLVSFDEDGNAVYNQPFAYEISSESTGEDGTVNGRGEVYVTPDTAGAHPEVTITNRATSVSIEKRDISGNPLTGAVLELWKQADSVDAGVAADEDRTKAANGDILLETWTSDGTPHELTAELAVGGTYYLREAEVPAGYVQAADILFTVENGDPITLVMEDENQAGVLGQIQVTKRLSAIDETTFDNIDLVAEDATVYVGLFTDAQGEHPYGEDYVKGIHIQDASSGTVTFDNLPSGTYYVFETQQDGTVIPYGELQADAAGSGAGFICAGDGSNGGVKEITLNPDTGAPEGSTELGNVYYGDLPDGFAYQGELMITKAVMKDGAPADSSDTFYAGIFTSETETVPYKVVALENNGTVTVEVPLGGENGMDPVTYYIYETDADGNKIDKNSFAYTVSGEGTVDLDVDNTTAGRTIINTMASDPDTTRTIREKNDSDTKKISTDTSKKSTGTNRRTSSSKTGDDTRVGLYLLFFAAAAVGIILTLRKRKEDKPE